MLRTLVILLAATFLAVPVSRRLAFGSIVGYLVAGAAIGPQGFGLVTDLGAIGQVAAFGVIMLLFLIGLEVRPHRLWILRKAVFGLGVGQLLPAAGALAVCAHFVGLDWPAAAIIGVGLALSSTAIVLPMLGERNLLSSMAGRDSFAVLLFQDMAFIPLVALVPLLGGETPAHVPWLAAAKGLGAVVALLVGGTLLARPALSVASRAGAPEVFTATSLLLVAATAYIADWAGLSMSLGAFVAGVMLSDSEYRHQIQADIEPFEGLLLGFFFISVGMSADLKLALGQPGRVAASLGVLLAVKIGLGFLLEWYKRGTVKSALRFALALPEASEFSFVLFGAAVSAGVLAQADADLATLVVAVSMVATPVLFALSERFLLPQMESRKPARAEAIAAAPAAVIICGFGRMGQVVGRILRMQGIAFTALDGDPGQIEVVRRFGSKVYFGNPAQAEVLRAAGAAQARVLVVAVDDQDAALAVAALAKREFRQLRIYARARNRRHAHLLMGLGVDGIIRETFFSSLRLAELVLDGLDVPQDTARRAIEIFREHDERMLAETLEIAGDEQALIQSSQQAAQELGDLFETDQEGGDNQSQTEESAGI
jgi:CPA2 family monovalent cation:H+ antiporter-2/glutathione-regulated potassium-efflux system protein KefB